MFKERQVLDPNPLVEKLEALLGAKVSSCKLDYISSGYTGGVYSVGLAHPGRTDTNCIIKRIYGSDEWTIYGDFLEPYKLNSPAYLGKIDIQGDIYIVMEKISPNPEITHDEWLQAASAWLAEKDRTCLKNLSKLRQIESIKKELNRGDKWWPIMEECARSGRYPEINAKTYKKIEAQRDTLERYVDLLHKGPQTVIHNDFQKRNTLYGRNGKLYVIDWSGPCIGSVAVDLARLIAANPKLHHELLGSYLECIRVDNLDTLLHMARFRNAISIFTWMCKAINDGQGRAVEQEYDINLYIKEIIEHKPVC